MELRGSQAEFSRQQFTITKIFFKNGDAFPIAPKTGLCGAGSNRCATPAWSFAQQTHEVVAASQ
jgi:hypothetical protein